MENTKYIGEVEYQLEKGGKGIVHIGLNSDPYSENFDFLSIREDIENKIREAIKSQDRTALEGDNANYELKKTHRLM